jgi:Sec-independent protein translocase protein TatA
LQNFRKIDIFGKIGKIVKIVKNDQKTFKNEKSPETRLQEFESAECSFRPSFARQKRHIGEKSIKKNNFKFMKFFKNL